MANRLLLAAYFVWRFFTKQWWDIFYWSRARVLHSLMRLRDPRKLTDHQLLSLLSWHAHQTEKATKHRSANRPGEKARGHRHFAALEHYLAELATRPRLDASEGGAIAWIRDVRDEYAHWRDTPGHINIAGIAAPESSAPTTPRPDDVADLIHRRTSARVWLPRKIPDEIIEQLIDAGLQAPSSCNRQGVVINVVENSFPREAKEGVNNAFMLHNAPAIFYITADPSLYPERQAPALDAGMAAQNILLLAESLGLAGRAM
ncbi:MAG: nitroreductase family protein [Phycisphaerales bacterium]|nr:nitroreductase family protein [Phycisphaerales bacterium]